ncbi:hypothetical protein [Streptomyces sp. NPDC093089]|uniref:hypothetical protein n=1 Tax=Streptomyces sp. NPDC093089 TaxID=3366024 RepID=UPI0037F15226
MLDELQDRIDDVRGTKERLNWVLILARRHGRSPFTGAETTALPGFVGQAALALELTTAAVTPSR